MTQDRQHTDTERLDAIARGDVEIECMGTTRPYQNVYASNGAAYTTAGGKMTLRECLDAALVTPTR